ncbi:hypothetical protein KIPB_015836, partial [Kipferlia bialata]
ECVAQTAPGAVWSQVSNPLGPKGDPTPARPLVSYPFTPISQGPPPPQETHAHTESTSVPREPSHPSHSYAAESEAPAHTEAEPQTDSDIINYPFTRATSSHGRGLEGERPSLAMGAHPPGISMGDGLSLSNPSPPSQSLSMTSQAMFSGGGPASMYPSQYPAFGVYGEDMPPFPEDQ